MFKSRGNILANIPRVTKVLLIANIAVFLLDNVTGHVIRNFLAMYTIHSGHFQPYQVITHMFLHGSFNHLFMNMFGLFMFGKSLEMVLGEKKFFTLYFVSGLGAAGLQLLIYYLQEVPSGVVGASGAIFGILAAFAVMFPNVEMMIIFLPIPIKAKYFLPIYAVIELFFGVANFQFDNVAHFAHLGGAIAGLILVLYWKKTQFRNHMY